MNLLPRIQYHVLSCEVVAEVLKRFQELGGKLREIDRSVEGGIRGRYAEIAVHLQASRQ